MSFQLENTSHGLRRRREFAAPALDPTPGTYAGVRSAPFVAPALKLAETLTKGFVRQIDGIQNKAVISSLSSTGVLAAANCDWDSTDSLVLGEQVLELTDVAVMEALCRGTLLPTWAGMTGARETMTAGSPEFVTFSMATVAAYAAQGVEQAIWQGSSVVPQGFLSNSGTFNNAGYRLSKIAAGGTEAAPVAQEQVVTATGFTSAVILTGIGAFNETYTKAVSTIPGILNRTDVAYYCSPQVAGIYMHALANSGASQGVNLQSTNQAFDTLQYLGIPIHVCPGMPNDALVLTYEENLVVGSNLMTDYTSAQYIDAWQFDGSDNVKIAMRFGLGMQVGITSDVVVGAYDAVIGD
tara:strand:- start:43 stop:1101 length:1059 start_codon:yes stop_codon:yes gene_type:complete